MGVGNAPHVHRFYQFLQDRFGTRNPIEVYQINTTGRVGAEYEWVEETVGGQKMSVPRAKFAERDGKKRPVGGTGPSIEETEMFLFQAARGAVEYAPHPLYGAKVLVPTRVPGISAKRLKEFDPFSYRSVDAMHAILRAQNEQSKAAMAEQCPGLEEKILKVMDL
jgi:phosphoenolpyruvate carboxykinase (ATP)